MSDDLDAYLRANTYLKCLIKGPPGSGKTVLASMATKSWRTLYADVDGGIVSSLKNVNRKNLTVRILRESSNEKFLERIGAVLDEAESGKYECFVLDHITEVASRIEEQLAENASMDGYDKFRDLLKRMMKLARVLRDMPIHTIVTAHTRTTGKEDATSVFDLAISGQSGGLIPAYFDVVGLMRSKMEKTTPIYSFVTTGPSLYRVRDRWRALAFEERVDESKPGAIWTKLKAGMDKVVLSGQEIPAK